MEDENLIAELPVSRIYWHDAEHTILIQEARGRWTWEEAHESLKVVNDTLFAQEKSVCTIHWLHHFTILPKGNALSNLRRLMTADPPNEQLVIVVGASSVMSAFLRTVLRAYRMTGAISKYHYVDTFDEALKIIEAHRSIPDPA